MSLKLILPVELADDIEPYLPPDVVIVRVDSQGNFDQDPQDAEVYINWYYLQRSTLHKVLAATPALLWHHTVSAGVNHLLTPTFLERNLILTNSAGVNAVAVAEFVLTFMLYHCKQIITLQTLQDERNWIKGLELQELMGATVLIIGTGSVGCAVAVRAKAFGMKVLGARRHPQPLPGFDQVVGLGEWRSLLPLADYVVIAIPLTPETQGMIDESALRAMDSHAYLVNVARGAVVEEPALLKALTEGWIGGAALDTFLTEPLPPESPFWSLPNVFVTPHCAGTSRQLRQRLVALFLDNFGRYRSGRPLRNVVNQKLGY
ncbi:D-2-hydroxyacid dehydrogenase [Nodularia spumigena]|uniref:D-2-hydroxyacid dehydrogenase n=1 Tax=Nodularia spumigena TaxID=70799 RepID=UPI00232CAC90|nr:D-2-hydroxyacid dehydrogenase [Nodularia spumigena]MDB9317681.1 D-2-hydroxyacid dehydrogenase [Nodularia spumigena CS-590/01A]MDB9326835.1 D-2-hydroxyacid dehydrogenase [Nodularia spumigena CS-590/02]MDB9337051.1 D-2-hydroxyacid dehydrogenase [Nodularia spumigena CS-590/01]